MNFDYEKAYCTQAVPSFKNLDKEVLKAHKKLLPLVGELSQGRSLAIPLNDKIKAIFNTLSTVQIANLSRASYFVGHWYPSLLLRLFDNSKGESWKITNCADQILRTRLKTPHNIEIHEGVFRVTFSNSSCWMWEEFGLAIEKNLEIFKESKLPFDEMALKSSVDKLAKVTCDMWQDVESVPENKLYRKYLKLKMERQKAKIKRDFKDKIDSLEQNKINAHKEIEFLLACNELTVPVDDVIYYKHTNEFCFGWRDSMAEKEKESILKKLGKLTEKYNITFK